MPSKPPRILIVDDQQAIREELAFALDYEQFRTAEAADGKTALALLETEGDVDLVLLDIKMPGLDGLQVLTTIAATYPGLPVVMVSGHGDLETAVVAVRKGAHDFLTKPFDTDRVLVSIRNALAYKSLATENRQLKKALAPEVEILGESQEVADVRSLVSRVAPTDAQVLITGENGTGKELVARALHAESKRADRPFVAVNCAAIPRELVESELFGHEKGAFTGASKQRRGHFEAADGGTLFLDEIGEMAPEVQAKLLRTLQDHVVTRLGGSDSIEVDVRVLAATNQDLEKMVEEKEFREDLYYRLHVIRIHVPPLRERVGDINRLAQHFLEAACRRNGFDQRALGADALTWLRGQSWPGNVRQLKNLMEGAAILAEGDTVTPDELLALSTPPAKRAAGGGQDWFAMETLEEFRTGTEREFIRRKIAENEGNIKRTAERIGIQRSNLYKKLDRYHLR